MKERETKLENRLIEILRSFRLLAQQLAFSSTTE